MSSRPPLGETQGEGVSAEVLHFPEIGTPLRQVLDGIAEGVDWVWQDFVALGVVTLLAAEPKVGKTTLIAHLLSHLVEGLPFLGRPTTRPAAIYMLSEESTTLARRLRECGVDSKVEKVSLEFRLLDSRRNWTQHMQDLGMIPRGSLVILDTGSRFWNVEDENQSAQIDAAMRPLIRLAQERHLAVIFVHHMRKGSNQSRGDVLGFVRGSSALVGAADIIVGLTKTKGAIRRVRVEGRLETGELVIELGAEGYMLVEDNVAEGRGSYIQERQMLGSLPTSRPRPKRKSPGQKAEELLKTALEAGPFPVKEITKRAAEMGVSEPTLRRAKKRLGVEAIKIGRSWSWLLEGDQGDQGGHFA